MKYGIQSVFQGIYEKMCVLVLLLNANIILRQKKKKKVLHINRKEDENSIRGH
jgi:hypothetical protein